jgi:hypothetical protein
MDKSFPESKIMRILDKHKIAWSWMGDVVFVGKDRAYKIIPIKKELLAVKDVKQGYDGEGNYIAFAKNRG